MSIFDQEYYVMSMDGADNHPLLTWGNINFTPFLKAQPVDENSFELPLKLVFAEPFPTKYEMADLLMLDSLFAVSNKLKELFEKLNSYGVQFVPIEVKPNKGDSITGHFVLHIWNKIAAIDKNNYEGDEPDDDMDGKIFSLQKFSLAAKVLENIPLEKRLVFPLAEHDIVVVVHKTICEAIQSANLTGMKFFRVDDWDDNAMFR